MLEQLLKLYTMVMVTGVTSPLPHLFGPPGCGKSTVAQQLADLVNRQLHVINVSRLSPLEVEGVQMPVDVETDKRRLHLILSAMWDRLNDGDILLFDEFLRGFPEVYNALLDIITSRMVAGHKLPRVFIMAASNSIVTYDKALEDRLHHIPVPDPRRNKAVARNLAEMIVAQLGLLPEVTSSIQMERVLDNEVKPMFDVLDALKARHSSPAQVKGHSVRNLIGQAQMRDIKVPSLKDLITYNNQLALRQGKPQYVFLFNSASIKECGEAYKKAAEVLRAEKRDLLTEIQAQNLDLNFQLLELEAIRHERGITTDDDDDIFDDEPPF